MTPKKIYNERPDIREKVMQDYPIARKEKRCPTEASKREALRWERAKRYYELSGIAAAGQLNSNEGIETYKAMYQTK